MLNVRLHVFSIRATRAVGGVSMIGDVRTIVRTIGTKNDVHAAPIMSIHHETKRSEQHEEVRRIISKMVSVGNVWLMTSIGSWARIIGR